MVVSSLSTPAFIIDSSGRIYGNGMDLSANVVVNTTDPSGAIIVNNDACIIYPTGSIAIHNTDAFFGFNDTNLAGIRMFYGRSAASSLETPNSSYNLRIGFAGSLGNQISSAITISSDGNMVFGNSRLTGLNGNLIYQGVTLVRQGRSLSSNLSASGTSFFNGPVDISGTCNLRNRLGGISAFFDQTSRSLKIIDDLSVINGGTFSATGSSASINVGPQSGVSITNPTIQNLTCRDANGTSALIVNAGPSAFLPLVRIGSMTGISSTNLANDLVIGGSLYVKGGIRYGGTLNGQAATPITPLATTASLIDVIAKINAIITLLNG